MTWTVKFLGTDSQIEKIEELYTSHQYIIGSAVNPRDSDLEVVDVGDSIIFNGDKTFSTGARTSDLLVLEGVLKGSDIHVFVYTPSNQKGITYDDWNNHYLGQRLSESGSAHIRNVEVPWGQALGFIDKQPPAARAYSTLNFPALEQIFNNLYLGIAEGALLKALQYTQSKTRSWPYGGYPTTAGVDEWYIREGYGYLFSKLQAAEAFIDLVGKKNSYILHNKSNSLTEQERGDIAVQIAAAKVNVVELGLEITNKIFELTGARASATKYGFDLFWRNLRTHSLHDPIAYKKWEVGIYIVAGEIPTPTWYT